MRKNIWRAANIINKVMIVRCGLKGEILQEDFNKSMFVIWVSPVGRTMFYVKFVKIIESNFDVYRINLKIKGRSGVKVSYMALKQMKWIETLIHTRELSKFI